jgi:hypothetical protein
MTSNCAFCETDQPLYSCLDDNGEFEYVCVECLEVQPDPENITRVR